MSWTPGSLGTHRRYRNMTSEVYDAYGKAGKAGKAVESLHYGPGALASDPSFP